ncbi:hypothetical protein SAMN04489740_4251 [Arthrobacter alpinus]|uniref:Uncharacterized protein n=1 Tax=Arthrobacter alpinus TaxID=656366 RepID=A0A1H5PF83_9MICC|nr:hypothetical protein [Arthrobacter alpinus]SEF12505.1 hypothetical protein SAMN04489740_4251 [Arthrobacter alpinus]
MIDANLATLLAGLIGAIGGAGGSIGAQIVGNRSSAKQEKTRLNFEEERFDRETSARSKELVFDSKRLAFVHALKLTGEALDFIMDARRNLQNLLNGKLSQQDRQYAKQWFTNWRTAHAEVLLLDIALKPEMENVQLVFQAWISQMSTVNNSRGLEQYLEVDRAIEILTVSMQASLAGP